MLAIVKRTEDNKDFYDKVSPQYEDNQIIVDADSYIDEDKSIRCTCIFLLNEQVHEVDLSASELEALPDYHDVEIK